MPLCIVPVSQLYERQSPRARNRRRLYANPKQSAERLEYFGVLKGFVVNNSRVFLFDGRAFDQLFKRWLPLEAVVFKYEYVPNFRYLQQMFFCKFYVYLQHCTNSVFPGELLLCFGTSARQVKCNTILATAIRRVFWYRQRSRTEYTPKIIWSYKAVYRLWKLSLVPEICLGRTKSAHNTKFSLSDVLAFSDNFDVLKASYMKPFIFIGLRVCIKHHLPALLSFP